MGMRELAQMDGNPPPEPAHAQRIRREGGGRKQILSKDPTLLRDLESLIDPVTRGDPESPLRWTQLGRRFPWQRTPQNALDEAAARQV